MNERLQSKLSTNEVVEKLAAKILRNLGNKICSYLNIRDNKIEELLNNFTIKSELSGHNNQICLLEFYDNQKMFLGDICLKYSLEKKKMKGLQTEFNILNILRTNNILCPNIIDANFSNERNPSYILMETIKGRCVNDHDVDIQEAESILDIIQSHESVLLNNLQALQSSTIISDLYQKIDFENKLSDFFLNFAPDFIIKDSFNFLNQYLNDIEMLRKRVIVTDRSVENIFIDENNRIVMIDFSTIRIGTQFDNWIQFIDDPRVTFSCAKEELVTLFLKKNNLSGKDLDSFHASSIYTNLLQGIFTYRMSPQLGISYINNANNSFKKLTKKKGVLIDISH